MPQVVILLGAPGAGKGTQAERLAKVYSLPHVATGDLFRDNLGRETAIGVRAKNYMEAGKLVPDEIVLEMLFDRVARDDCREGYVLDGFPRTLAQAEALAPRLAAGAQTLVFNLSVDDETIVSRAAGRLLCRECGHIHHREFSPPAVEGKCDACGGELYQRKDDQPDVVRERLRVYHRETEPLVSYYRERGHLREVDGEQSPDDVHRALRALIDDGRGRSEGA